LMSVAVREASGALEPRAPVSLRENVDAFLMVSAGRAFDVSKDGRRIVTVQTIPSTNANSQAVPRIIVIQNWFEELKRRVPSR